MTFEQLTKADLLQIMEDTGVHKIMGRVKCKMVKVDHVPARPSISYPRDADEAPLVVLPQDPIEITFQLVDAMIGGSIYAAITANDRVVIEPFPWISYDNLTTLKLSVKEEPSRPFAGLTHPNKR